MKLRDILKSKGAGFESIEPDTSVAVAIEQLTDKKIGSLLVMSGDELVGIITDRDVFWKVCRMGDKKLAGKVKEFMTEKLIVGVPDDEVETAMAYMTNNRFRHLPVMEDKKVVGVVSIGDLVKAQVHNLKIENRFLTDYITGKYPA